MILEPARLLLVFRESKKREEMRRVTSPASSHLRRGRIRGTQAPRNGVRRTATRFWVKTESDKPITEEHFQRIEAALGRELDFISGVYGIAGVHGLAGLSRRLRMYC